MQPYSVQSSLQPHRGPHPSSPPRSQVEVWCQLAGWGLVRVGSVPVVYDANFRCTFPEICEAEIHAVRRHAHT